MEKTKIFNGKKLEPINKRVKVGDKLDSLWKPESKSRLESKKLVVRLKTKGTEKRKILLKLESGSSNIHTGNFGLIAELLKEFFKNGES